MIVGSIFIFRSFAANPNLPGDVNSDNKVNITDLSILLTGFGRAGTSADFNGDGQININDLSILLSNYGKTYGGTPNPPGPTPTPPGPTPNPGGMPPITRDGTKLMRAGKQWKFAGINADKWFGCWGGEQVPNDAVLEKYFRELNPGSLTRIWPYQHMGDSAMMDKVIAAAHRNNQYLMVTLFDGNDGQCGSDDIDAPDAVPRNMAAITPFINRYRKGTHPAANAIAVWEMSNEDCSGDWFKAMAPKIKALDPNTLISTGSHAAWCYSGTGAYTSAHDSPAIDLISMHEYDNGYSSWSGPAIQAAKQLNKPWFSGESGLCCGGGDTGSESGNASKAKSEMDQYINQTESAGMLYWASRTTSASYDVNINGGPMWDMFKNYRHPYQGQ
jgi:hypothetical protein